MGYVIRINPQIRAERIVSVLDPRKELREILHADMGADVAELYDKVISELEEDENSGDDYEAMADGYRNMLVDVMNELHEIVMQKRLNRDRLEQLYTDLEGNI